MNFSLCQGDKGDTDDAQYAICVNNVLDLRVEIDLFHFGGISLFKAPFSDGGGIFGIQCDLIRRLAWVLSQIVNNELMTGLMRIVVLTLVFSNLSLIFANFALSFSRAAALFADNPFASAVIFIRGPIRY